MDKFLNINYVLVESENLQEYMEYIGVNFILRKLVSTVKQTLRLSRNADGTYKFELITPVTTSAAIFTPGVEFDEERSDGEKVKSLITFDGNIMTHRQTDKTGKTSVSVREYHADKMTSRTTAEGFDKTLVRHYVVK